jgi:hypothetical protein
MPLSVQRMPVVPYPMIHLLLGLLGRLKCGLGLLGRLSGWLGLQRLQGGLVVMRDLL